MAPRPRYRGARAVAALGAPVGCRRDDATFLWTRVQSDDAAVDVRWEVATDDTFDDVVADGEARASADTDFTVKVVALGLRPRTSYRYRFLVGASTSPTGLTRTAPAPDDDVPVRIAVASCQDFVGRWYHAWRALLDEGDVDLVLFLGDYIYENVADPRYQEPTPERSVSIPDGLELTDDPGNVSAVSLADYRALYRQIRSDPDLMEVHRRFPFVLMGRPRARERRLAGRHQRVRRGPGRGGRPRAPRGRDACLGRVPARRRALRP